MKGAIKLPAAATDQLGGLSHDEAARRLKRYGPNRLVRASRGAAILAFIRTAADPMAVMLAAAGAVYYALGERIDAYVLFAAIVPVLAVDVILEARSRSLRASSRRVREWFAVVSRPRLRLRTLSPVICCS